MQHKLNVQRFDNITVASYKDNPIIISEARKSLSRKQLLMSIMPTYAYILYRNEQNLDCKIAAF